MKSNTPAYIRGALLPFFSLQALNGEMPDGLSFSIVIHFIINFFKYFRPRSMQVTSTTRRFPTILFTPLETGAGVTAQTRCARIRWRRTRKRVSFRPFANIAKRRPTSDSSMKRSEEYLSSTASGTRWITSYESGRRNSTD